MSIPATARFAGAVNPADTASISRAYQHTTDRDNVFNQTDFIYKTATGPLFHTVGVRHRVRPADRRRHPQYRHLSERHQHDIVANPFAPTYFGPVTFIHHFTGTNTRRRHHARFEQQISAEHRIRPMFADTSRDYALAAVDRRRALRPLRHVGARHEHQHHIAPGSTTWSRRGGRDRQADRQSVDLRHCTASPICRHPATSSVRSTTAP